MTRDAGLQLQSYAWTGNYNGKFHSRVRRGGWPSKFVVCQRCVAIMTGTSLYTMYVVL